MLQLIDNCIFNLFHPARANAVLILKQKVARLELLHSTLLSNVTTYSQIETLFGGKLNARTEKGIYSLSNGLVFHFDSAALSLHSSPSMICNTYLSPQS